MYKSFLNVAFKAAKTGGDVIRKGFFNLKDVKYKSFANPVTQYDIESEKRIVEIILKNFKNHSILTEEILSTERKNEFTWIIDPLDGTVNFAHQIPFVAVSIALEIEKDIKVGVIYNPVLEELYYAIKGKGAYFCSGKFKNKQIYVSNISEPSKALLVTGFPYERGGRIEYLAEPIKIINKKFTGFRRLGSAALDLAYVARGSFEGFYEENLKPWDTASGFLIVKEAGGKVTDYYGEEYSIYKKTIVASNGIIHDEILSFTKNIPSP